MITLEQALSTGRGTERPFNCPVHEDRNASASVNVNKGVWCCYACGAKGRVDGVIDTAPSDVLKEVSRLLAPKRALAESWLDQFDAAGAGAYWLTRYERSTCRHYRLGVDPVTGKATYPLRDSAGNPLGVVLRNADGRPKYLYPRGINVSELLFGYDSGKRDVIIMVEGATDVMAARDVEYEAWGMYGSRFSPYQADLLVKAGVNKVIWMTDMDAAGHAAAAQGRELLNERGIISVRPTWESYKDLDDAPRAIRRVILDDAVALAAKTLW